MKFEKCRKDTYIYILLHSVNQSEQIKRKRHPHVIDKL